MLRAGGFQSSRFLRGFPGKHYLVDAQRSQNRLPFVATCTVQKVKWNITGQYSLEILSLVNFLIVSYVKITFVVYSIHVLILTHQKCVYNICLFSLYKIQISLKQKILRPSYMYYKTT